MWAEIAAAAMNYLGQQSANSANQASVNNQLAFQDQQSRTQYQRAVADMTSAGINPMLASQVGGNAAMTGAAFTQNQNLGAAATGGYASAAGSAQAAAATDNLKAQADNQKAQALLNLNLAAKAKQDTITSASTANMQGSSSALMQVQYNEVLRRIDLMQTQMGLNTAQTNLVKRQAANAILTGQNIQANTGNTLVDTALKKLAIPQATNRADVQDTWFMRNVEPFLPGVLSSAQSARGFSSVLK